MERGCRGHSDVWVVTADSSVRFVSDDVDIEQRLETACSERWASVAAKFQRKMRRVIHTDDLSRQ
jgi:hypothetical protein